MKNEKVLINESEYEKWIIENAIKIGWRYLDFQDVFVLRDGKLNEVILRKELISFLKTSQKLKDSQISYVLRKLKDLYGSSLEESNKLFCEYFIEGIKIYDDIAKKSITVKIHKEDFNSFIITNQLRVSSTHPDYKNQIPDVVLYLNGLPVVVMELKRPSNNDMDGLEKAYNQIQNYKTHIKKLFVFNLFNIISDGDLSKIGSLTASLGRHLNWRGENFQSVSTKIFSDLMKPNVFIELANNYTFYVKNGKKLNKIIAGYHQYYGVKSSLKSISKAIETNKKGGVFWHTQGSGKSYSMIFLVKNLSHKKIGTTFIVVTDRKDLDEQLYKNFGLAKDYVRQKIHKIRTIKELKTEIAGRKQNGVFFTTIQKFTEDVGELITRENVVVISDEAHRSQNNIQGRYIVDIQKQTYGKKFGSAKFLRTAFPNATFIGFTGTPIEKNDVSTRAIFGQFVSQYTMKDAENDGVVVEINYEPRKPELHLNHKNLKILDEKNLEIQKILKTTSSLPNEVQKKINKEIKRLENIIGDSDRIKGICIDIISHYKKRKNLVAGKAMIVALNRKIALSYYKTIIKLDPSFKDKVKLICTTNPQSDDWEIKELVGSKIERSRRAIDFKNANSNFKIAIVVDMWLTGFDIPPLDTLYLDKPLKMHNLMQAIARTNRVYTDKEKRIVKESSLIVDYIGIWGKLCEALAFYSNKQKNEVDANQNLKNYSKEAIKKLDLVYKNFEIDKLKINFDNCLNNQGYAFNSVEKIANLVLEKKRQIEFVDASRILSKILKKVISKIDEKQRIKFALLLSARQKLIKLALDEIDFIKIKKELLLGIDNAIDYTKTIALSKIQSQVVKLSDMRKFLDISMKNKKMNDLELKQNAIVIKHIIAEIKKISIEKASKLSNDLKKMMNQYDKNFISSKELQDGLIFLKLESDKALNSKESDGLTNEERNFYEILEKPIMQTNYDRSNIKKIMTELVKIVNDDNLVNRQWMFNPILKRKTRNRLRMLLKKYNYPPKDIEITRDKVIEIIISNRELNDE